MAALLRTSDIDWAALGAVGSIGAIAVAVILALAGAVRRKREKYAEIRRFYEPLDNHLCHLRLFALNIREECLDQKSNLVSIRGFRNAHANLVKFRELPINVWPHVNVSLMLGHILANAEKVIAYMPNGELNHNTPHSGGGAGLIDELDFDTEQMVAAVRRVTPKLTLGQLLKRQWHMYLMRREINRIAKKLEGHEIPSLRIIPRILRAAIRDEIGRLRE